MKPIQTLDDVKMLSQSEINERWDEVKKAMEPKPLEPKQEHDPQQIKAWAQKDYKPIEIISKQMSDEPSQAVKVFDTKLKIGTVRIGLKNMTVNEINNTWPLILAQSKNK